MTLEKKERKSCTCNNAKEKVLEMYTSGTHKTTKNECKTLVYPG